MVGYWKIFVKRKLVLCSAVLVALGLSIYLPALSAGFVLDDEGQIVHNEIIRSLQNFPLFFQGGTFYGGDAKQLVGGFYRPVMTVLYSGIYQVVGLNPFPYHLVSVLIHCINSILVFLFLRKMFAKTTNKAIPDMLPFLLSAIFLVHPMMISGVAYIAAINEPLFFFFGLIGLLIITSFPSSKLWLVAAMLSFFASLLSKETAILFMISAYLYLRLFKRRQTLWYVIASILTLAIYLAMRCGIAHMCNGRTGIGPLATMPFDKYIMQIPAIIFFYLSTFVLPARLAISQEWIVRQTDITTFYGPLIVDAIVIIACIVIVFYMYYDATNLKLLDKEKYRHADHLPNIFVLFFGILVLGLLMHIHIIPLDFTVDEHWFYFPMLGLLGMVGLIIPQKPKTYVLLTIIVGLLAYRTYLRTFDWHDNYRLFRHDILYSSDSAALTNNLATELFRRQRYTEAQEHYVKATKIDPDRPVAWTNLGIIAEKQNTPQKARMYYKTAIQKGNYYRAYELYASLLIRNNNKQTARIFLTDTAIPRFPHNETLRYLLDEATK